MCIDPQVYKNSNDMPVPCGNCVECKSRRVSAWSFRLMAEEREAASAYFITLTYDNANAKSLITRNGFLSLEPKHLQLYFKRLRKASEKESSEVQPIKYYAVGEYGGKSKRPHYHLILFNAKLELIDPAWDMGNVYFGDVSGASVGYVLKYISKPSKIPMHRNDDRLPEFSRMSKGLGKSYLTEKIIQWHRNDLENRMYLNIQNGKKASMPRYYKDRIYTVEEREKISEAALLKAARDHQNRATRIMEQGLSCPTARQISEAATRILNSQPVKNKI